MKSKIFFYFFLLLSISLSCVFTSCEYEELAANDVNPDPKLIFSGILVDCNEPSTRYPGSMLLQRQYFDTKFYFARLVGKDRACGAYLIPIEYPGFFRSYGDRDSLVWKSLNEEHVFVGWTMPWLVDYQENQNEYKITYDPYMDNFKDGTRVSFNADDPMYDFVKRHGNDIIKNNTNCDILETFIGTRSNVLIYNDRNSEIRDYVPNLLFRHLVSKIYISGITFASIGPDGKLTTRNINRGYMTFRNMPSEGVFYREHEGYPAVLANPDAKQEITYEIVPNAVFYICPGVDFSKVEFSIKATDSSVTSSGEFMGDFKTVKFIRNPNDIWDKEHIDDPNWETTLYAGETMSLKLNLRQGKGTFVNVAISKWDTYNPREGTSHPYQGIYDPDLFKELFSAWKNPETGEDEYTDDMEDYIFSKYGDIYFDEDGNEIKEYRIYEDCSSPLSMCLGKKYGVNGMGHTITFTSTYNNTQVRIPRIKDVYLTDGKGNTVYIDENYNIYTVDSNGNMTATGESLEELEGDNVCFVISLITGAKHQDPKVIG